MKEEKIEISWEGWKVVIPISVLGFIFILNLFAEIKLASSYCKQLADVFVFLLFCSFLIIIGGTIEHLSKPMRTYIEKKLFR